MAQVLREAGVLHHITSSHCLAQLCLKWDPASENMNRSHGGTDTSDTSGCSWGLLGGPSPVVHSSPSGCVYWLTTSQILLQRRTLVHQHLRTHFPSSKPATDFKCWFSSPQGGTSLSWNFVSSVSLTETMTSLPLRLHLAWFSPSATYFLPSLSPESSP